MDKSIVELRALLASYEERLSTISDRTPGSHAALAQILEPLFLINDLAIDLRTSALDNYAEIEAPGIVDCLQPQESEPFLFVYKVTAGVFRVHPRKSKLTAAVIGPFSGPAPSGFVASVRTSHGSAPPVRFHMSTWLGEIDTGRIEARFEPAGERARFLTVPPRHQGFLVSTDSPRSAEPDSAPDWALVLATIADPPEEIGFAWAEFSDIALIFSTADGFEVCRLS